MAGSFLARSHPPGHGSDDYGTDTVYLEGYSGAVIDRMHNATPVPFPTPTVVPKRNAPVIDAARALQAVAHFAQGSIRDEGSEPELSTFGHMPAPVSSTLLGRYARDYPVWIVSANAADDQPAGSGKPLLETFYIDGYSGEVLVESRDLATTPTP